MKDLSGIKSVIKTIKQSNIITQELKTVEKLNIFDIKSITAEHLKTAITLSKSPNEPKIITQQPRKIKIYRFNNC